ncbi:MAG: hypothetical protein E7Z80_05840 [Methanobrevibacter thaueri]|nr:hypothetical protein [Methanobrevibacter thaueri]
MGAVSAHDNLNGTDSILKDSEYNLNVEDAVEVEQNKYIPVEVKSDEAWSLNVYIDGKESPVNDDFSNVSYDQIDIPTSVVVDGEEVPLTVGSHRMIYEFKFINTTSLYKPEVTVDESDLYFDFQPIRSLKNPQNAIYRFNTQLNIIGSTEPATQILTPDNISVTYSDTFFVSIKGITSADASFYIDDKLFTSDYVDEISYETEFDSSKLAVGSYNFVCIIETDKLYGEYGVRADFSDSELHITFSKSSSVRTPNRYKIIVNTTLNVCDIPDLNPIYVNAPEIDIAHTRSIPVYLEGEGTGNLTVFIDSKKVYDNPISLKWTNPLYIPTKSNVDYFDVGAHDLSFEFKPSNSYISYTPKISCNNNEYTFSFTNSKQSYDFLNDKYIINTKLNILKKNTEFVPIVSKDSVNIVHTKDINLKIEGLDEVYNLTVYVDDVEVYDRQISNNTISIKTFTPRESIDETNEKDIKEGTHSLRFEFHALHEYDVEGEFKNNVMNFKFTQKNSNTNYVGINYQLNTSLIVTQKPETVHILNVKNNNYFDDTEFIVKMDTYKPEIGEDWDDEDENPIGTQDVGIIVSNANGEVYKGDGFINVYKRQIWNYDFENELLSKPGKYTMKIINLADNTYDTASFEVKKVNSIFSRKYSSNDFEVLFNLDFSSFKGNINEPCIVTLDGKEKSVNIGKYSSKGKNEVLFKDVDPGVYTATFSVNGNDIYNDVTLKLKVTVKKENPDVTYEKNGNKIDLKINIPKSKTDAVLVVSAGGVKKKFPVDKNTGHITADFSSLNSGSYDVEIFFEGNERYNSKSLSTSIDISHPAPQPQPPIPDPQPQPQPGNDDNESGKGVGNNTGGTGTGSGDGNVTGSGNGNYDRKLPINVKGSNGDFGSQGSGHSGGVKSYEISKIIKNLNENSFEQMMVIIATLVLLIISFVYERHDDDTEEY